MFEELLNLENLSKRQAKKVAAITKKFSENSVANLETAETLMFDFLCESNDYAFNIVLDVLTKIEFKGNFNRWQFIEPAYTIKYYLSKDEAEKQAIRTMLTQKVRSKLDTDEDRKIYLDKVRNGLLLDMTLEHYEEYEPENRTEKFDFAISKLTDYLHILAIGATGKISEEECLEQIKTNLQLARELYKK